MSAAGLQSGDESGGEAPADELALAMRDHQDGRLAEAESAYRAILERSPGDGDAAHYLGMLRFQNGATDEGLALVHRSIEADPANPHAWNNLGNMRVQLQHDSQAADAYLRATSLDPQLAAAWLNLARVYMRERKFDPAIEALHNVIRARAGVPAALQALANIYYRLNRTSEAADVYERWVRELPDDPTPRHMLAAISGRSVPDRADDRYIIDTFDGFAASFDELLQKLDYIAPQLVAARLIEHPAYLSGRASVLDAGCGTGWCGPLLRSTAGCLAGVDLSPQMLARARDRGVYDELHQAELRAFLAGRPGSFDIIVSADVLCYFGLLDAVVRAAHDALLPNGLLCFSVEALTDPAGGDHFRLGTHGRYAHARQYVERVMVDAGFGQLGVDEAVLRQELGVPVGGYIAAGRRKA